MFKILIPYLLVYDLVIFIVASDFWPPLYINYKNYMMLVLNCQLSKVRYFLSL